MRYLAISKTKLQYTLFDILNNCKLLKEISYICKSAEPIFSTRTKSICETELLFSIENRPKSCDKRIIQPSTEIWHKLDNKNQWVFVLQKTSGKTICCEPENNFKDINISGTYELSTKCKAYTTSTILISEANYISNYQSILLEFNIRLL